MPLDADIVIAAGVFTVLITVALVLTSLFVPSTQCSIDYSVSRYLLVLLFTTSILWFFLALVMPGNQWMGMGMCALGALMFGVYIVIDTQIIMNGSRYGITNDDYVLAAMIIYLDMLNLFLRLLRLLAELKKK